jgi:hypothetical protein
MASGKSLTYRIYGYRIDKEGKYTIVPEEAEVVCLIFSMYLEWKSYSQMAETLFERGIRSVSGNERWYHSAFETILHNEKYCGDVLFQKTYACKPLGIKKKVNKELEKYIVRDDHEPIVSRETFRKACEKRKSNTKNFHSDRHLAPLAQSSYFYSSEAGKCYVLKTDHKKGHEYQVLVVRKKDYRRQLNYRDMVSCIQECANYINGTEGLGVEQILKDYAESKLWVDSARLSELYSSLEGKSPRDQLSIYSEISSLLVSIARRKLVDVSGKRIFDLAEKVTSTFDIYSAK